MQPCFSLWLHNSLCAKRPRLSRCTVESCSLRTCRRLRPAVTSRAGLDADIVPERHVLGNVRGGAQGGVVGPADALMGATVDGGVEVAGLSLPLTARGDIGLDEVLPADGVRGEVRIAFEGHHPVRLGENYSVQDGSCLHSFSLGSLTMGTTPPLPVGGDCRPADGVLRDCRLSDHPRSDEGRFEVQPFDSPNLEMT